MHSVSAGKARERRANHELSCPQCRYLLFDRPLPRICPECGLHVTADLTGTLLSWESDGHHSFLSRFAQFVWEGTFDSQRYLKRFGDSTHVRVFGARPLVLTVLLAHVIVAWTAGMISCAVGTIIYRMDNGYWAPGAYEVWHWSVQLWPRLRNDHLPWILTWVSLTVLQVVTCRLWHMRTLFSTILIVFAPSFLVASMASSVSTLASSLFPVSLAVLVVHITPILHVAILGWTCWNLVTFNMQFGRR